MTVTYVEDGVDVEVVTRSTAGPGPRADVGSRSGHGLLGLRERTRLLGGVLEYGALDGAGFRVAAHLPSSMAVAP